jgi:hypothetical protein
MSLSSENARFIKNNLLYILVPIYMFVVFYLPGMIFTTVFPMFTVDNFLLRQILNIVYSIFVSGPLLYLSKDKD